MTVDEMNKVIKSWSTRAMIARNTLEMKAKAKALGHDWVVDQEVMSLGQVLLADEVIQTLTRELHQLQCKQVDARAKARNFLLDVKKELEEPGPVTVERMLDAIREEILTYD